MARSQSIIALLIKVMGDHAAVNKLKKVQNAMGRMGAASKLAAKPFAPIGAMLRFAGSAAGAFGKAMRNAFAYGSLRLFTNVLRGAISSIKEASVLSVSLSRTSAILSQGFQGASTEARNYENTYNSLIDTMARGKKTQYLSMKQLTDVGFVTAIAGLRGDKFTQTLEMMDKMSAITGESAKDLSADFIRVMNAFGMGAGEFKKGGDILMSGITNAVMMMPDLLNAVKMLGPTWRLAFGEGAEQLTEFTAAMGSLANLGLRGGQGARYLNRMIMGLLAPTSEVASSMREFGFNIYDTSQGGAEAAAAMDTLTDSIKEEKTTLKELYAARSRAIVQGRDLAKIDEEIAASEEKVSDWNKRIEEEHEQIVRNGGKLQKFSNIVSDIVQASKGAGQMQIAELFKKMFQLRGTRGALAITAQFEDFLRLKEKIENSGGVLDEMFAKVLPTWGFSLNVLQSAMSKVKEILTETFVGPWLKTLAGGLTEHVLEPMLQSLGGWEKIKERVEKFADLKFTPWVKDFGKTITMAIEGAPEEEQRAQGEKTLKPIRKLLDALWEGAKENIRTAFDSINWQYYGEQVAQGVVKGMIHGIVWLEKKARELRNRALGGIITDQADRTTKAPQNLEEFFLGQLIKWVKGTPKEQPNYMKDLIYRYPPQYNSPGAPKSGAVSSPGPRMASAGVGRDAQGNLVYTKFGTYVSALEEQSKAIRDSVASGGEENKYIAEKVKELYQVGNAIKNAAGDFVITFRTVREAMEYMNNNIQNRSAVDRRPQVGQSE